MATPILRDAGSSVPQTGANAIANNAYANSADKVHISLATIGTNYLLADFRLTSVTFASAPVAGAIQLVKVPRDFSGNAGPTPAASMLATQVWTFGPSPSTGNASTGWVMSVDAVPLDSDADYWLFNNGTGVSLNSGWVLTYVPWSPGT